MEFVRITDIPKNAGLGLGTHVRRR